MSCECPAAVEDKTPSCETHTLFRSHVLTLPHPSPSKKPAWVGSQGQIRCYAHPGELRDGGICNRRPGWSGRGEEMCRDTDDPLSRWVGSVRRPFHTTFCIFRCRVSLYVHAPACMRGWRGAGGALKSLAEKGISCGGERWGGGRKRAGPLAPH